MITNTALYFTELVIVLVSKKKLKEKRIRLTDSRGKKGKFGARLNIHDSKMFVNVTLCRILTGVVFLFIYLFVYLPHINSQQTLHLIH